MMHLTTYERAMTVTRPITPAIRGVLRGVR